MSFEQREYLSELPVRIQGWYRLAILKKEHFLDLERIVNHPQVLALSHRPKTPANWIDIWICESTPFYAGSKSWLLSRWFTRGIFCGSQLVGFVGLQSLGPHRASLTFALDPNESHRDELHLAIQTFVQLGFAHLGLSFIETSALIVNAAYCQVLRTTGFQVVSKKARVDGASKGLMEHFFELTPDRYRTYHNCELKFGQG